MKISTNKLTLKVLLVFSIILLNACSKDSNDPTPQETTITVSTADFSKTMDENPTSGQQIGTVQGSTNEGSVTFSITEQNPAGAFSIDSASGELKVADEALFDFETNPTITGTVKVANGAVSKNALVTITLNDVNEENVYNGSVVLFTQEEVNDFGANNYTVITGALTIGNIDTQPSQITDLSPLNKLKIVESRINIATNDLLENLDGLNNLEDIGGYLWIGNNPLLNNISALFHVSEIGGYLYIENNDNLINLNGLDNVVSISSDLGIYSNENLSNINSLQNLTTIGGELIFENNPNLLDFNFSSLTVISERLDIRYCPKITNLNSLSNLNTVGTDIYLWSNFGLIDLCGLQNLLFGDGLGGDYTAYGNAYNPTEQDIIDGNCSL
ncbi:MAG: hypothetical protein KDC78_09030 [Aequorivita sp.]|nr:hypothetical protein [Aequorivita sp.]